MKTEHRISNLWKFKQTV